MDEQKNQKVKRTIGISEPIYEWVKEWGENHGLDYTSAVNFLLATAKNNLEIEEAKKRQGIGEDPPNVTAGKVAEF